MRFASSVFVLERVCLGFAALGLLLPFAYALPVFTPYRHAVAVAIGDAALANGGPTLTLVLGITGGSIAGKWLLHWAIVRFGVRARMRWAREATLVGLLSWFVLDSASSLAGGAWANVVMVNLLPPLLVLPLLGRVWVDCDQASPAALAPHAGPSKLALAAFLVGASSGLAIALGMDTPLFDAWRLGLGSAHFGGAAVPPAARSLVRYFAGPIGGATLGHFALAAYVARHALPAGASWAWRWTLASVLAWAAVDSSYSLAVGAGFNVLLVNLPCLALLVPPLLWAGARSERA